MPSPRWHHEARYRACSIPLPRAARSFFVTAACPFARRRAVWPHARPGTRLDEGLRGVCRQQRANLHPLRVFWLRRIERFGTVIAAKFPAPYFCFSSLFTCNLNGLSVPHALSCKENWRYVRVSISNGILLARALALARARSLAMISSTERFPNLKEYKPGPVLFPPRFFLLPPQ